jgi:FkbM family methyltransferase
VGSIRQAGADRLERYLRRHPYRVAWVAERLSAHTLADRADAVRSGGDLVPIRIPPGPGDLRARRIKMWRNHGRDLVVDALRQGWRQFETPTLDQFIAEVRAAPSQLMDVGANTGLYSLLAIAVGARHAHAFEPLPATAEQLHRNIAENHMFGRITPVDNAVSDAEGTATLYVPPPSFGDPIESSASLSPAFKETIAEQLQVPVTTLDAYWTGIGRPNVGVVKIDVESREADVLDGAHELVEQQRPVIFYELLPAGDAERIAAFARKHDLVDSYASPVEVVFNQPIQHMPHAWNHVLVPREKLQRAIDRYSALDLVCTVLP